MYIYRVHQVGTHRQVSQAMAKLQHSLALASQPTLPRPHHMDSQHQGMERHLEVRVGNAGNIWPERLN